MSNPKALPGYIYFRKEGHNFIQHVKFTLIEELTKKEDVSKAALKFGLKQRGFLDVKTRYFDRQRSKPRT